ncbi:CAP-Gly domain-containing linker protein 1-like [Schistocerca gregaria]|uniref:CAP-Gly domain-containing linker protein 1-like n=1 Tax=Schistocerca gregaria TaxID=7010 RepID=UPI00211F3FD2|nr:CAP-Gly domain-containing linker protein 1-like [Schistocerca gregaria]
MESCASVRNSSKETSALEVISSALKEANLEEKDVLGGNPAVLSVLNQHRDQIDILYDDSRVHLLSVYLDQCEELSQLGFQRKVYSVDCSKTVAYTISLICSKLLSRRDLNYRKYALYTESGNCLNESNTLKDYGLGSIMRRWDVYMVRKTPEQLARQAGIKLMDDNFYLVTFLLPSTPEFQGATGITKKVNPKTPCGTFIKLICTRYKIANTSNWYLCARTGMLLSLNKSLEYYGLGRNLVTMTLKVIPKSEAQSKGKDDAPNYFGGMSMQYAWTQIDEQLTLKEALALIREIDKRFEKFKVNHHNEVTKFQKEKMVLLYCLAERNENYENLSRNFEDSVKKLASMRKLLENSRSRCDSLAEERGGLQEEVKSLSVELEHAQKRIMDGVRAYEELERKYASEQVAFKNTESALNGRVRTLETNLSEEERRVEKLLSKLGNTKRQLSDVESHLSDVESRLSKETSRVEELTAQDASNQSIISSQKAAIEALESWKSTAEENISKLNETLIERYSEVNELTRNIAVLSCSKEQLETKVQEMQDEVEKLNRQLEGLNAQKEEVEHNYASYKVDMATEVEALERKIRDAKAQLESSEAQRSEEQAQYERQLTEMRKNFDSTISFQGELKSANLALKDALLRREKELEESTNANQLLNQNLSETKKELQDANRDLASLRKELKILHVQIANSEEALKREQTASKETRAQVESLSQQLNDERKNAVSMGEVVKDLDSTVTRLKQELSANKESLENQRCQYERSLAEAQALHERALANLEGSKKQQYADLKSEISKLAAEKQDLSRKLAETSASLNDQKKQISELKHSQQSSTSQLGALERKLSNSTRELESTLLQVTKLRSDLNDKEKTIRQLSARVDALSKVKLRLKEKEKTIQRLNEKIEQLSKQLLAPPPVDKALSPRPEAPPSDAGTPPGPPVPNYDAIPAPPTPLPVTSFSSERSVMNRTFEKDIQTMRETLSRIDVSKLDKKKNFGGDYIATILMSGLEKRFKLAREGSDDNGSDVEYEVLESDNLPVDIGDEEDNWRD